MIHTVYDRAYRSVWRLLQRSPFQEGVAAPSIDGTVPFSAQTGWLVTSAKQGALRGSMETTPFAPDKVASRQLLDVANTPPWKEE
jgi:hypothetical protein